MTCAKLAPFVAYFWPPPPGLFGVLISKERLSLKGRFMISTEQLRVAKFTQRGNWEHTSMEELRGPSVDFAVIRIWSPTWRL